VVEEEPLLALELARTLTDVGCVVIGPAGTAAESERLVGKAHIDGAFLDANLSVGSVDEVASMLIQRMCLLPSRPTRERWCRRFAAVLPALAKPFTEEKLFATVRQLIESHTAPELH
jgi:hypothetical protein